MKKLFVILFVMLSAVVAAQPGGGRRNTGTAEERAKREADRLGTLLALTADQKVKIEAAEVDLQKQLDQRRQGTQGNFEAMRPIMEEIGKAREEKYKVILTADQFKKFTDDRDERQRQRGQGGGGGQRPGGGQGGQGGQRRN